LGGFLFYKFVPQNKLLVSIKPGGQKLYRCNIKPGIILVDGATDEIARFQDQKQVQSNE